MMHVGNFIFSCLVCLVCSLVIGSQPAQAALDPDERAAIDALCTSITNLSTNGGAGWSNVCSGTKVGNGAGEIVPAGLSINPSTNKITQIDLQNKGLQGRLPKEIGKLSSELTHFFMTGNEISGDLPKEIGDMSALVQVWLGYNKFTGSVPPSIGRLSNLLDLKLSGNGFTGSLPDALGNLSELHDLALDGNEFYGVLPPTLNNLKKLKKLSLSNNKLTGGLPTFVNSPDVAFLYLSNNAFTGNIPNHWKKLSELKDLSLSGNKLVGVVPDFSQTKICQLYIHRNAFTFADILPNDLANRTRIANCGSGWYVFEPQANIDSVRGASVGNSLSVNYRHHPSDQIQWYRGVVGSSTEIAGATATNYIPLASGTYFYQVKNPSLPPESSSNNLVLTSHLITVTKTASFSISGEVIGNAPDNKINDITISLFSRSGNINYKLVKLSQKAPFQFQNRLVTGDDYQIDIAHQDNIVCTPKTTKGTVKQSNISITIRCDLTVNKYRVNVNVSGLPLGKMLTLSLNGASDLTFTGTGGVLNRPFSAALNDGSTYRVRVAQNPTSVECVVQNPLGGKINGADVTESIICQAKAQYTLSVGVQGLESNKTFELTNGGDILVINGNGQVTFGQQYFDGTNYNVQVSKQPANQQCVVQNGTGKFNGANVTSVVIVCTTAAQREKIFENGFE